jgi:metal-responsive CopG/Arc/MetJ family transcriptional regulator
MKGVLSMPRMNIAFNEKAYKVLNELQKKTGKSKSELLRNALALLDYAEERKDKNEKIVVTDNENNIQREILIP